jgi:hypothetical protein
MPCCSCLRPGSSPPCTAGGTSPTVHPAAAAAAATGLRLRHAPSLNSTLRHRSRCNIALPMQGVRRFGTSTHASTSGTSTQLGAYHRLKVSAKAASFGIRSCCAPFCRVVAVHPGQVALSHRPAAAATAGLPAGDTLQQATHNACNLSLLLHS